MIGNTLYIKNDAPDSILGYEAVWDKNKTTYDILSEAIEGKPRDVSYPQSLSDIITWDNNKDNFSIVRRLNDESYEFQYSDAALRKKHEKMVADEKRFYELCKEGAARGIIKNDIELRDLLGQTRIREQQEREFVEINDKISLDKKGNLQNMTSITTQAFKKVDLNIKTGDISVSDEADVSTTYIESNIIAINDQSITNYLDEIVTTFKLEYEQNNSD